jgi:copper transport protein
VVTLAPRGGRGRTALAAAVSLALWLMLPSIAFAHASFVRSDPADPCGPVAAPRLPAADPRCETGLVLDQPPSTVRITFSEPVQTVGRGIRVVSPSGKAIQQGKAVAEGDGASVAVDATEQGTYVVQWQILSEDTHPARGEFAFSVGQPSARAVGSGADVGQVTPLGLTLQALGRWLHFAGFALGFGTIGMSLLLVRLQPELKLPAMPLWKLSSAGIVLLLLAEPLALLGQTGSLGADQMLDGDSLADALASPFGRLLAFRVAAALLLWVIGGSFFQEPPGAAGQQDRFARDAAYPMVGRPMAMGAAVGLGVVLALIDGLGQHAASFPLVGLGLAVHAIHLMAMALWLGSVCVLIVTWRQDKALKSTSRIAVGALIAVAASGLAMAVVHIPGPGALFATAYGQALAAKQVLLLIALAFGWLAFRARRGRSMHIAELSALGLLIGLAGLLVSLPPPR